MIDKKPPLPQEIAEQIPNYVPTFDYGQKNVEVFLRKQEYVQTTTEEVLRNQPCNCWNK